MLTNLSDKEIRQELCKNGYIIDYFRPPQKYFFVVAMTGLILATIAQFIISIFALHKIEKINKFVDEIENSERNVPYFNYICNRIDECTNISLYEKQKNKCSKPIDCYDFKGDFYLTDKCEYSSEYIYNCTKSENDYTCKVIGECADIDELNSQYNCSYWDNCPDYDYFYFYGYCNFTNDYIYNCTANDKYYNTYLISPGYNCDKYARCSEVDHITNYCSNWQNCKIRDNNFNYTYYCNHVDFIYKCKHVYLDHDIFNDLNYFGYFLIEFLFNLIFYIGIVQFVVIIPLFILSQTCWKQKFFFKMLEIPFTRYMLHFFPSIIYPVAIFIEILILMYCHLNNIHISLIVFLIVQIISFVFFILGLFYVKKNKSDIEIIENSSELTKPLVKNY